MPPPMHSAAMPFLASRRCISCSSVTRMRQPDAPIGCPMAIAPPLTLTLRRVDAQLLVDGAGLRGEGFVELEQIDVGGLPAGALQRLARGRHRAHAHGGRVQAAGGERGDASQRLQAQRGGLLRRHHHHGGGAVVDARGVARRHRAGLVKRRAQAGQRFGIGLPVDELVGVEDASDRPSSAECETGTISSLNLPASCAAAAFCWLASASASCMSRLMPCCLGHVLGRDAHVVLVVDVPQAVDDHGVDHLPVAHALAVARARQHVRRGAHVLLAAGDHDLAVAPGDRLRRQHHGLQAGAADGVDGQCRALPWASRP